MSVTCTSACQVCYIVRPISIVSANAIPIQTPGQASNSQTWHSYSNGSVKLASSPTRSSAVGLAYQTSPILH
jgi:hypothetical protein